MMQASKTTTCLLLLLTLGALAWGETCPPQEEVHPCICEELENPLLSCSDSEITLYQLKQIMNPFIKLRKIHIQLEELNLGELPSNFFKGLDIEVLDISHCELDRLDDADGPALQGLEDSLKELVIVSSFDEDNGPVKLSLGHLRRLEELDLSFNEITELNDDWFDRGPVTLKHLTLSNNGIEKLGERAFANLVNLKELMLDGNRFGSLRRSMLPSLAPSLENLEFDNNALTSIPEDLFSNLPSLKYVSFRNNGLKRLEQRTWQPVWQQLSALYLEGNPIDCDGHMNWIFPLQPSPSVRGTCYSPEESRGDDLGEFIRSRQ